ncbi:MAG: hypothetical protein ACYC2K_03265 [Gemmatimonadales bacterium]
MRRLVPVLLLGALFSQPIQAQTQPASQVDWDALATQIVTRNLQLAPGERVVLFWDQGSDRGAAAAFRRAIAASGGVVSAELSAPTEAEAAGIERLSPERRTLQRTRRDAAWAAAFAGADVAIWLPTPTSTLADRPFERLVEGSKVRAIHFHWFLPPDRSDVGLIDSLYVAAMAVPPADLDARMAAIDRAVRGKTVRITAPNGTNLSFRIPADAWVHRNTGDVSRAKVANARTVRDREEELPASVFRTTALTGVEGRAIGYASFDTRGPILDATFSGNRVTRLVSARGGDALVASWQSRSGDKAIASEFVIGTNPALPAVLPSGFMPYYGYGAGIVRVSFGDNWESGGKNRVPGHLETLLFIPQATVTADGVVIVKDGELDRGYFR